MTEETTRYADEPSTLQEVFGALGDPPLSNESIFDDFEWPRVKIPGLSVIVILIAIGFLVVLAR